MIASVAGLDLSLSATGLCRIQADGTVEDPTVIATKPGGDDVVKRGARLAVIGRRVVELLEPIDLVVVEAPAYSSSTGSMHDRSGLWWLVVHTLLTSGKCVRTVIPQHRAMYATGRGQAGKQEVMAAVIKRYPTVNIVDDNAADALVLAAIGRRWLDQPIEDSLPETHLRVMARLAWQPIGVPA